jgi:hypothetical protein
MSRLLLSHYRGIIITSSDIRYRGKLAFCLSQQIPNAMILSENTKREQINTYNKHQFLIIHREPIYPLQHYDDFFHVNMPFQELTGDEIKLCGDLIFPLSKNSCINSISEKILATLDIDPTNLIKFHN